MAYYSNAVIAEVDRLARIYYIDRALAKGWNEKSRGDELRLLTGWCWTSKDGGRSHAQGLKTMSAAYRDAWYHLVGRRDTPLIAKPRQVRLRLVKSGEVTRAAA